MIRVGGLCSAASLVLVAVGAAAPARAQEALAPYQMVRSLQLVQDRIAAGDHAALPMQAKLLELVDARLRKATADDLKDPKNVRALLVYGMSGGNPATVKAATESAGLDAYLQTVANGVLAYLGGRPAEAIEALQPVDPMTLTPDLGAFVALVKGSLLTSEDPVQALTLLDRARLLSPGTLVEEAALRRTIGIAATNGDATRFLRAATQYVGRYLHSPYASQFADAFVSGVIAMHQAISLDRLADITGMMDAEREKVIYLRIARRAAIEGLTELSAFAAGRAEQGRGGKTNEDDPRALLYASLSAMTSTNLDELREKLKKIDRNRLSEADRALFDAALAVTREITAPPATVATAEKPVAPAVRDPVPAAPSNGATDPVGDAGASATTALQAADDLPPVEGAVSERPAEPTTAERPVGQQTAGLSDNQPAGAAPAGSASQPAVSDVAAAGDELLDAPASAAIADARRKLEQIDQLLGASPQ